MPAYWIYFSYVGIRWPKCYSVTGPLVRELLSNNSLLVGKLYEDKSLALHARGPIFFTTDLETVNYYTTIHC